MLGTGLEGCEFMRKNGVFLNPVAFGAIFMRFGKTAPASRSENVKAHMT